MFTGIVEETGVIRSLSRKKDAYRLNILTGKRLASLKEGDSLSVNGTCLTAVVINENSLFFDIMEKTFANTSFRYSKKGDVVNVERSLEEDARLEGHFVLGHVDGVRRIKAIRKEGRHAYIDVGIAKADKIHIVEKGSITIDGISLTIGDISENRARVHIIPHTLLNTNLRYKKAGDRVNIEFDILGKYIQRQSLYRKEPAASGVTKSFLKDKGFI
jgi:riboflavin synthase